METNTETPSPSFPVTFYFDPACPWTWITSRWLVEVAPHRNLDVTWELFSLRYRNRDNPGYDWIRQELDDQHPAMRILAAAHAQHGNAAVGRLYETLGSLIHHDRDSSLHHLRSAVLDAGLEEEILVAGADPRWDPVLESSTDRGLALVGDDAGIPLMVVGANPVVFFGPVMSPAPTGVDAVALWDAYAVLGRFDGLYEIKRTRSVRPQFGDHPRLATRIADG